MLRRTPAPSATPYESPADRLQATVDELAGNVRVLTDVVDQIREDLSWLTRNGMPHQPLHVFVHRMPLVSTAESHGSVELSFGSLPVRDPTADTLVDDQLRNDIIDQVVERLAEPLGHLAQEQLNELLTIMDHAHREVLQAIRAPQPIVSGDPPTKAPRRRRNKKSAEVPTTSTPPAEPPPPRGRLF